MDIPQEMQTIVHRFLHAVFEGNPADLPAIALPHPKLTALARPRPTPEQLESLQGDFENVQMHLVMERGPSVTLHVYFRGMIFPITLVQTADGPKVDARWWIAMTRQPTEADQTARAFMFAVMTGNQEMAAQIAIENPALDVLIGPAAPSGEMAQYENVAMNLSMVELEPGDEYPYTPEQMAKVTPEMLSEDRKFLLTQIEGMEIPLPMRRIDGHWRVDAGPWIRLCVIARGGKIVER